MKNLLFLLLIISTFSYSQDYYEKYNELYSRYEYYDSNNNLIKYKKWNTLYQRWEWYNVGSNSGSSIQQPIDLELTQRAMASQQSRYDRNFNRVKKVAREIGDSFMNLDYDKSLKRYALIIFQDYLKILNDSNINYSNTASVDKAVNWLYDVQLKILSQVNQRAREDKERSMNRLPKGIKTSFAHHVDTDRPLWLNKEAKGGVLYYVPVDADIYIQENCGKNNTYCKVYVNGYIGYLTRGSLKYYVND